MPCCASVVLTLRSTNRASGENSADCTLPVPWPRVFNGGSSDARSWRVAVKNFVIPSTIGIGGISPFVHDASDDKTQDGDWIVDESAGVALTPHIELRLHFAATTDALDTSGSGGSVVFFQAVTDGLAPSTQNAHSDLWFPCALNASTELRAQLFDADGQSLMYSSADGGTRDVGPPEWVCQLQFEAIDSPS